MDFRSFFTGMFLAIATATGISAAAQVHPDSLSVHPVTDTLATRAKVDSLRDASILKLPPKPGKSAAQWLFSADSLRKEYRFEASLEALASASEAAPNPDETARIVEVEAQIRNARSLMGYCTTPVMVASRLCSRNEFLRYCPSANGSWRPMGDDIVYSVPGARASYFSSTDNAGVRNIYCTVPTDSLWTAPRLISEALTSPENEINPMLSPDGRTLYFASKGLYGMGGYDLYASHWNRERKDWDVPVNLGFPFSSPYDDYMFYNTDDGRYSVLVSNRGCPADSVCIFVLEYDAMPARKSIRDEEELRRLSALEESHKSSDGDGLNLYMDRMNEVRKLRDSLSVASAAYDALRVSLATAAADSMHTLAFRVLDSEASLKLMRARLDRASKALQETEMNFLSSGVGRGAASAAQFEFPDNTLGEPLELVFDASGTVPIGELDILPVAEFASTLPSGLVYQIEIAGDVNRMEAAELKGLSPVFEHMGSNLRYTYTAGIFPTYASALAQLNRVRLLGFRSARIVASRDGVAVNPDEARRNTSELPAWSVDISSSVLPMTQVELIGNEKGL